MSTLDCDFLNPSPEAEAHTCKKFRLIPNPDSEFVNLRCASCLQVVTAFSNSNVPISCPECNAPLAFPTGGKIRLADGVTLRTKINT